jgi:hypothetical protein
VASIVLGLGLGASESAAVEAVTVSVTVESHVWAMNGDSVRQPMVPLIQKIATPQIQLTDIAIVNPTRNAVTQLNIPDNFGGTQTVTVSETTGGNRILVVNPTNRFDPFTGKFTNVAEGDAGTATVFGGPYGGKGGEFPINMRTRTVLDIIDAGGEFFVVEIPRPGEPPLQVGVNATVTFDGTVALLEIPVDGTIFGTGWTTGMLTISKAVTTMRKFGDPAGTPTGFHTFTFMSTGTFGKNVSTAITPFVVEAFAGVGPNRVPSPFYGFLRSRIEGLTFVPESRVLLMAASVLALAALGSRREKRADKAKSRGETDNWGREFPARCGPR